MEQVQLNGDELIEFITYLLDNNIFIQQQGKIPTAIEVESESGLGKTSIVKQIADSKVDNFVKINLSQIEEIGDLVGVPLQQFKLIKPTGEGKGLLKWATNKTMDYWIGQGFKPTDETRMTYSPPEWIQGLTGTGILLLDDYSRADMRFMQAIMEILDRQEYMSWKLPKGWTVILTSNPDNGEYIVTPMDSAQKTRYTSVVLKWDAEVWARWAEKNEIDTRCINFILMHPEIVKEENRGKVNPRSLTTFFNSISSIPNFSDTKQMAMIQKLAEGSVGPDVANMFVQFVGNNLDKIISPKEILTHKDTNHVIKSIKAAVGFGGEYKNSVASILCMRILNYAMLQAENGPIPKEMTNRLIAIITTKEDILTSDISFVLAKKLNATGKFTGLMMDTKVQEIMVG